jgi:hypothetical protein
MIESRMNEAQFDEVKQLTKRVEEMTKAREDSQTKLLEAHGVSLADMKTTLDLLVERTKDLPDLAKRVTRLESWKSFVGGIAAAFTMIGGTIGFIVGLITRLK